MESLTVQRIKLLIEQEKETPASFAKRIKVTPTAVYKWFDGGQPRLSIIEKIVQAYPKYTPEWLMGGDTKVVDGTLQFKVEKLEQENARLWALVERLTGQLNSTGKAVGNFLRALTKAGVPVGNQVYLQPTGAQVGAQRA